MPDASNSTELSDQQQQAIEQAFATVNPPIWLVTASAGNRRGGLVATCVMRAAIDPERPLLIVGLAPNHFTAELVLSAGCFGLHLVTAAEADLAWMFALASGRDRDKLAGLELFQSRTGAPLLRRSLAWFDARVLTHVDAGDRLFFWADVLAAGRPGSGVPLGEGDFLASGTAEQRATLKTDRQQDIARHRPLHAAWRAGLRAASAPRA